MFNDRMRASTHVFVEGWDIATWWRSFYNPRHADRSWWIVTLNPEILVAAAQDASYADALRFADVRLVDGFGLRGLMRLRGQRVTRVAGIDLAEDVLRVAVERGWRVCLVGGCAGVAADAARRWRQKYQTLQIMIEEGGSVDREGREDIKTRAARERIILYHPDVLFVAFGHPKQERWIARHHQDFLHTRIVIGVGGAFDVWAERVSRAPRWIRFVGCEWAWRFSREPRRWRRILDALVLFPFFAITRRIKIDIGERPR